MHAKAAYVLRAVRGRVTSSRVASARPARLRYGIVAEIKNRTNRTPVRTGKATTALTDHTHPPRIQEAHVALAHRCPQVAQADRDEAALGGLIACTSLNRLPPPPPPLARHPRALCAMPSVAASPSAPLVCSGGPATPPRAPTASSHPGADPVAAAASSYPGAPPPPPFLRGPRRAR